ncbi:MAG TPA: cyclic nucleotide-binding domain-containing protein [Aggregatilineaceae bacterium]|nr:cyclic nucleotide-binding domain-containing protein [Aggregatilineaceae bacterium]
MAGEETILTEEQERRLRNLLSDVPDETFKDMLCDVRIMKYPAREQLCRQGEYADKFFILITGEVGVYAEVGDEMFQIDKIRDGCFGEIALLLNRKRTAFIYTKEETKVLEISRPHFIRLVRHCPEFANTVTRMVIERMVEQDKAALSRVKPQPKERDAAIKYTLGEYTFVRPVFGPPEEDKQYETDILMIMPFRDDLTAVYENYVKRVASKLGLVIKRADDFFSQHSIVSEIWAVTNAAKLVIADCTTKNPNVFYELGIAHTLGKPTIQISQQINDIPFDLQQWRYILYDPSISGMAKFEKELEEAIVKIRRWEKPAFND